MALPTADLNILSLCTGGGGLDLGLELAIPSARSVVLVEREAFAVAQLVSAMQQGLMAQAAVWSDVTTFSGRPWRGLVDGVIGGIPCQPHSMAGRKRGQHDERDLWSDARRIIVQSGAWFVVIENVGGMLSAGDDEIAGAERVWRDLRKLGFAVEGGLFTAAEVGASHERERVFVVAVADRSSDRQQWSEESNVRPVQTRQQSPRRGDVERCGSNVLHGVGLADADRSRPQGRRERDAEAGRQATERHAGLGGGEVGDTVSRGRDGRSDGEVGHPERRAAAERPVSGALFPPGPNDIPSWRDILARSPELEPAFRRVADGLAPRLDTARVDRLRMLGNGVVSLEAAYAIRTLIARLAARGATGAIELARLMLAA